MSVPKTLCAILACMIAFYTATLIFTDASEVAYGETTEMTRHIYKYITASQLWGWYPFIFLSYLNREKEEKLRRLLTYYAYATFYLSGALLSSGPQKQGGVFVDSEHNKHTILALFCLYVAGMGISSGPSATAKEPLYKMSSPAKIALVINQIFLTYYMLIMSGLSPISRFCASCDITDVTMVDAHRWFVASIACGSIWNMYVLAYEDLEVKKAFIVYCIFVDVIIEYLNRFTSLGAEIPAEAIMEGFIMRLVYIAVGVWAVFGQTLAKTKNV